MFMKFCSSSDLDFWICYHQWNFKITVKRWHPTKTISYWNNQDSLICYWHSRINTGKYAHELALEFLMHACETESLLIPKFQIYLSSFAIYHDLCLFNQLNSSYIVFMLRKIYIYFWSLILVLCSCLKILSCSYWVCL